MNSGQAAVFKTVALFGKHPTARADALWVDVARFVRDMGCEVLVEATAAHALEGHEFAPVDLQDIKAKADLAIVVGGDGTLLGVARELTDTSIPLIGVNQGRLGFMTDITLGEMRTQLGPILQGQYETESRSHFHARIYREGELIHDAMAINDVVISRGIVGGMIEIRVWVDKTYMYDLRADGLIVSTPTGSTAYALSAHGPILHPSLAGIVIVPVAPHALTNRPIALPDSAEIEIQIYGGRETGVHFDMQSHQVLELGDRVVINVSPSPIRLLHPQRYDYFAMLRQKLHWSAIPTEWSSQPRGLRDSGHA